MTTTESVIESLAAKLATADLNDAEVELLQSLLTEPDEVAGFASKDWTSILSIGVATKGVSWPGNNRVIDDKAGAHVDIQGTGRLTGNMGLSDGDTVERR